MDDTETISKSIINNQKNKMQLYLPPGFGKSYVAIDIIHTYIIENKNVYYITSRKILELDIIDKLKKKYGIEKETKTIQSAVKIINKEKKKEINISTNYSEYVENHERGNKLTLFCYESLKSYIDNGYSDEGAIYIIDESHHLVVDNNIEIMKKIDDISIKNKIVFMTGTPVKLIEKKKEVDMSDIKYFGEVIYNYGILNILNIQKTLKLQYPQFELIKFKNCYNSDNNNSNKISDNELKENIENDIELDQDKCDLSSEQHKMVIKNIMKEIEIKGSKCVLILVNRIDTINSYFDEIDGMNKKEYITFTIHSDNKKKLNKTHENGCILCETLKTNNNHFGNTHIKLEKAYNICNKENKKMIIIACDMIAEGFDFKYFESLYLIKKTTKVKTIQSIFRILRRNNDNNDNKVKYIYIPEVKKETDKQSSFIYNNMYQTVVDYVNNDKIKYITKNNKKNIYIYDDQLKDPENDKNQDIDNIDEICKDIVEENYKDNIEIDENKINYETYVGFSYYNNKTTIASKIDEMLKHLSEKINGKIETITTYIDVLKKQYGENYYIIFNMIKNRDKGYCIGAFNYINKPHVIDEFNCEILNKLKYLQNYSMLFDEDEKEIITNIINKEAISVANAKDKIEMIDKKIYEIIGKILPNRIDNSTLTDELVEKLNQYIWMPYSFVNYILFIYDVTSLNEFLVKHIKKRNNCINISLISFKNVIINEEHHRDFYVKYVLGKKIEYKGNSFKHIMIFGWKINIGQKHISLGNYRYEYNDSDPELDEKSILKLNEFINKQKKSNDYIEIDDENDDDIPIFNTFDKLLSKSIKNITIHTLVDNAEKLEIKLRNESEEIQDSIRKNNKIKGIYVFIVN